MDNSVNVTALNNVAIVKQFFKYYEKNDILGLREIFAPDIEWHVPGHHPLAGTKKGVRRTVCRVQRLRYPRGSEAGGGDGTPCRAEDLPASGL